MNTINKYDLTTLSTASTSSLISQFALSLASPILASKKIQAQEEILLKAIESKTLAQQDIMRTIRYLSANGSLTPEVFMQLLATYNHISERTP